MGRETSPADVRHPLRACAVVPVSDGWVVHRPLRGTRLVPAALRAPAQLTPSHSSTLMSAAMSRAREGSPAALRSACPCNLADGGDREEQQCGQQRRGSAHGLLQLPPHMGLLQGRASRRLRVLEEGAWCVRGKEWRRERDRCVRWSWVERAGRVLRQLGPPQQHTAEQQGAQVRAALHVRGGGLALAERPRRPAPPEGERQQVRAGACWAGGATSARRCPCARARHRRLDASAKSSDLAGVGELERDSTGSGAEAVGAGQGEASSPPGTSPSSSSASCSGA